MKVLNFSQWLQVHEPLFSAQHLNAFKSWNEAPRFEASAAGEELEIKILGPIGWDGINARSLSSALDGTRAKRIRVLINSPGGLAFEGEAMRALLARHRANVTIEILSIAASAASIIAMGGDVIEMHVGSQMMIHQASGMTFGTADDHEKSTKALRSLDAGLMQIYADRTGMDIAKVTKLVNAETWMGPEEALKLGFATSIITKTNPEKPSGESETLGDDEEDDDEERVTMRQSLPNKHQPVARALDELNRARVGASYWK
jgi:ATP-dependent Clp protease protease subunit